MYKIYLFLAIIFLLSGCTEEDLVIEAQGDNQELLDKISELEEQVVELQSDPAPVTEYEPEPGIVENEADGVEVVPIEEEEEVPAFVPVVEKPEEQQAADLPEEDFVREPLAEVITSGSEFQVSTILGNGTGTQSSSSLYYPAYTQRAKNGDIFFIDGDIKNHKIRKTSGGKVSTVMDLVNNKLNTTGEFFATGLVHIGKNLLMVSDSNDAYYIDGARIHRVPGDIPKYMQDHHLLGIWRMKKQGEDVYIMFNLKGHPNTYHLAQYNTDTNTITPIIEKSDFFKPFSFYVDDNNVYVGTQQGYIFREQLFPRQKTGYYRAGDNQVNVTDVWKTKDGYLMFSLHDGTYAWIMKETAEDFVTVAGSTRGYQDGVLDEVMMDNPMDFTYDGSGYIFSDPGNHVLRKLWTTLAPEEDI